MSTADNLTLHQLFNGVTVPTAKFSGIVGDARHAAEGGYHIGRAFQPASDYSVGGSGRNTSPRDRGGSPTASAAIDVTFGPEQMIVVTNRLLAAMGSPAMRGVREFNGTNDGVHTLNRDAVLGWRQNYNPDPSHLWHVHIGFFRDTAQDWAVISDVLAVINGTTPGPTPAPPAVPEPTATQRSQTMYQFANVKGPSGAPVFVSDGMHCRWVQNADEFEALCYRFNRAGLTDPEKRTVAGYDWASVNADPKNLTYLGVFEGPLPPNSPVKVGDGGTLVRL